MAISACLQPLFFFLFFFHVSETIAKAPSINTTDSSCSANAPDFCNAYVVYRARVPDYMNLRKISDLFGVSRLSIKEASNLDSEDDQKLASDQLLIIPLPCRCSGTNYSSNVSYEIKEGDSFYFVSTFVFENLTNYQEAERLNPSLHPTNLSNRDHVIFPIFCQCPTYNQSEKGVQFIITYVWQPSDSISQMSAMFNVSVDDFTSENGFENFSTAVALPVFIPATELPLLPKPSNSHSPGERSRLRRLLTIVLWSGIAVLVSSLACFLGFLHQRYFRREALDPEMIDAAKVKKAFDSEESGPGIKQGKLLPGLSGYLGKPIMYEAKAIMDATMSLAAQYKIGGTTYRATINGEVFAVKKTKDAKEELRILQKLNHTNLIKLTGISTDLDGSTFLVYEYAKNGSLDKWLYLYPKASPSSSSVTPLTWSQRVSIALDIANALHYLHEHAQPSIVHMDIRTSNILLDSRFRARVANFSMAKATTSLVQTKADVFAFGVVLLELLSGKRAMETKEGGKIAMLWKEIRVILEVEEQKKERLRGWMDQNLENFYPIDGALSLATLAKACILEKSSARPSMEEIAFSLSVLTHSSPETLDRSWIQSLQEEDSNHGLQMIPLLVSAHLLHQVFSYFDCDKDGKISISELQSCIQSIGDTITHDEAKWVVADFDGDGDGMLDIEDFMRLMSERASGDGEIDDDLKRAFEMFEAEKGSGCITPKSLQRALNRLGESKSCEECAAMIGAFDLDHNGVLDFQEFHQMMA
ncbi:hypothetical protein Sjap_016835 [Stephania japonica]|uniref:Uncharacterized protein n=1 Tax=Stephania japonica TaxID=461633 RepID=A0AAP0NJM1_9MAGN